MAMRRQSERMRKHTIADARWRPEVVVDPPELAAGPDQGRAAGAGRRGGREL
jgi:hypothetical protein